MAKFCPNCGKPLTAETVKFCPECGAPISPYSETTKPVASSVVNEQTEKIYFQDNKVKIGSKVWKFMGVLEDSPTQQVAKTIPVQAISSVDFIGNKMWWLYILIVLSVILTLAGFAVLSGNIYEIISLSSPELGYSIIAIFISLVFVVVGVLSFKTCVKRKRMGVKKGAILVSTNNILSSYKFKNIPVGEAEKYLAPMRQCLSEQH